uniref:Uncharacterized protein n=1 Tax=Panagrolaimus sp. JU765 TaxID=591449 RepID=A0AC34Q2Z3_9BILA
MKNSTLFFIFAVIATQAIIATAADSIAALQCVVSHKPQLSEINGNFANDVEAYFKNNANNAALTVEKCVVETEKTFDFHFKSFYIDVCHAPDTFWEIRITYSIELKKRCANLIAQRPPSPGTGPATLLKIMPFNPSFPLPASS